ncbi:MAG TPA: GrlR family regulatory protein [Geobacterales bacterium]|nr:GrlR family regulatory protein [Geobacterales bacterium]
MLVNGKYSAWFKIPLGEGTGIVVLEDGNVSGGDTVIAYSGCYKQDGDAFSADIAIKRHTPGQLSVFGIDDVDISLTGKSTGTVASCRGKSRQAPGMTFEATMIRMAD